MAFVNYLPRTVNTTGASCTGSSGASNRTYTLSETNALSEGIDIVVNGTTLLGGAGKDFTISGAVITFLNPLWDSSIIRINYFVTFSTTILSTTTSLKYSSPTLLAESLGISNDIPSWAAASSPTNEAVGTGDNSNATFYLDQKPIISDSYVLYANGSAMTETTHYVLDTDTGEISLTPAGVTLLSTNALTAKYSYYSNGMKDSYVIRVLGRAEKEVEKAVNSVFTDGTSTNPDYPVTTEIQATDGYFQDQYLTKLKPLIDVTSSLSADITSSDTTISLSSGDGSKFPSSGYIIIGSEVISYTGVSTDDLTGCSRGVLGTTAAAHSELDEVHTTIIFRSSTSEGTSVSWTVQPWHTSMHATSEGLIYKFKDSDPDQLTRKDIAERIKIIYLYGYDSIPSDITRLTLLFAKRQLIQDNIGKAMIAGRNEFNPEMLNADMEEIKRIINSYIVLPMGNV